MPCSRVASLALATAAVALVLVPSALAGIYAHISANWSDSSSVAVTVLSSHRFNGSVSDSCVPAGGPPAVTVTQALGGWVYDVIAHQYRDDVTFDMAAVGVGSGANCTITVTSGHKVLAEQSYVSV